MCAPRRPHGRSGRCESVREHAPSWVKASTFCASRPVPRRRAEGCGRRGGRGFCRLRILAPDRAAAATVRRLRLRSRCAATYSCSTPLRDHQPARTLSCMHSITSSQHVRTCKRMPATFGASTPAEALAQLRALHPSVDRYYAGLPRCGGGGPGNRAGTSIVDLARLPALNSCHSRIGPERRRRTCTSCSTARPRRSTTCSQCSTW